MEIPTSVEVIPGIGTVARVANAVFVCSELIEMSNLRALLARYESAFDDRSAPRRLALDLIEMVQPAGSDVPGFGLVVQGEAVTTLILSGTARARVVTDGDNVAELDGDNAVPWLERPIDSFESITLIVNDATQGAYGDLMAGVVAGAGLTLVRHESTVRAERNKPARVRPIPPILEIERQGDAGEMDGKEQDTRVSAPQIDDSVAEVLASAREAGRIENLLDAVEASSAAPLPKGPVAITFEDAIIVEGIDCKNGHFNDPGARFCGHCGIAMSHLTRELKVGERPGLGHLILDDGSTFVLDHDYVIGRDPERDQDVSSGQARPLRLSEDSLASRRHAAIRLTGWNVKIEDLGSANGTEIRQGNDDAVVTLLGGQSTVLKSGARVVIGASEMTFVLHNKL